MTDYYENEVHLTDGNDVIEYVTASQKSMTETRAAASFTLNRWKNRMRKLKTEHPRSVEITENPDGIMYCEFPASWIKINPPRKVSDKVREARAELAKTLNQKTAVSRKKSGNR